MELKIDNLQDIAEAKQKLAIQEELLLTKSMSSTDPDEIIKAQQFLKDIEKKSPTNNKSYIFEPWNFNNSFGYKDKPTSLSYNILRQMGRVPIINSIITTRIEQVSEFSRPNYDDNGTGFQIRKKKGYLNNENSDKKLSKKDEARIEWIVDFILNCGTDSNSWSGDTFDAFLRKFTRDSLELDQGTFEVVRSRKGQPVEFLATDGATFRLTESFEQDDGKFNMKEKVAINGYYPSYVQVFQNQIKAEFYPWELCFAVRNHYTDVRLNGYGVSELETIVNVTTWMLYSDTYNGKFFSQGSAPKGILKVSGGVNEARLAEFRQQWMAMVAGVQNAWRTPVLEADKMEWIDLQKGNRDMEFGKWQEYLIKLACATYKIDPSEIGFPMSGSSESKPMFEGNNEARLKYSKDKGLRPLLKMIEFKINKYIVNALAPEYEFVFVGLSAEDEAAQVDLDIKKMNYMGLKELRRTRNLPDEIDEDDVILSSAYLQYLGQKQQQEQMEQQQQQQMGNPESTEAVNDMSDYNGEDSDYMDYAGSRDAEEDPFAKAFNDWFEKELGNG